MRHTAACRRVADHRICRIEDEVFDLALGHERMLDHGFLPFSGSHIAYRRADTSLPDTCEAEELPGVIVGGTLAEPKC